MRLDGNLFYSAVKRSLSEEIRTISNYCIDASKGLTIDLKVKK